jgi:hypothetical protein
MIGKSANLPYCKNYQYSKEMQASTIGENRASVAIDISPAAKNLNDTPSASDSGRQAPTVGTSCKEHLNASCTNELHFSVSVSLICPQRENLEAGDPLSGQSLTPITMPNNYPYTYRGWHFSPGLRVASRQE